MPSFPRQESKIIQFQTDSQTIKSSWHPTWMEYYSVGVFVCDVFTNTVIPPMGKIIANILYNYHEVVKNP